MQVVTLLVLMAAAIAGAIGHEVAHWLVWRVAGRRPRLDLWGLTVLPRAGPQRTTRWDRAAAAAPYVVGMCALVSGLWAGEIAAIAFGVGMVQLPSKVDIETMCGRTEWRLPDVTDREGSAGS